MKKINLVIQLKNTQGELMTENNKPLMLNEMVANMISISRDTKQKPVRMWEVALKLLKTKQAIELDDEDFDAIEQIVIKSGSSVIVAGQILKIFEAVKIDKKDKEKKDKS